MHLSALAYVGLPALRRDGARERRRAAPHLAGGPRRRRREQGAVSRARRMRRRCAESQPSWSASCVGAGAARGAAACCSSWPIWSSRAPAASRCDFFTQMPAPAGETGGGVVHAIVGTLLIVGHRVPDRPADRHRGRASTAPSTRRAGSPGLTRFVADVLNGTPSIVVGVFAWTWIVRRRRSTSPRSPASAALAMLMIPMVLAHHRGDDQAGAQLAARGGAGAGLPALAHQPRHRGADARCRAS